MPTVVFVIGSDSSFLKYTDVGVKWLLRVWTNEHQWDVTPRKGETPVVTLSKFRLVFRDASLQRSMTRDLF